jgi:glycosyltransferase involved in cell wall biosynthesis
MKVLLLMNSLGAGGAERSMVEFAKFLHDKPEVCVKFVCLERREIGLEKEVAEFGIPTLYYSGKKGYSSKTKFLLKILEQESPEIIHSVLVESNIVLRFARLFYKKGKIVQSLVNTPYSKERKKDGKLPQHKFFLAKQMDKWTARIVSGIFYHSITKEVLNHYKPIYNIEDNFKIIFRGRNNNRFVGNTTKEKRFTLINAGRQEFAKGQIDILKAVKYIKQKYKLKDLKFQLLGRPGHYSSILNDYIDRNDLSANVEILGFVNNVEERLAKADVFVFPSYYEGLGGALIEAFAAKLPCVCSNIPVLKEVVGNEDGALFSEPGDYESLGENIYKLYRDENLREQLSQYSYSHFQSNYKLKEINEEMFQMYMDLIARK